MKNILHFILQWLGLKSPITQTTLAERNCLAMHAGGKKQLVEIGVFQGVTTRVLRTSMHPNGVLYGVDPFYKNRLGLCFYELIALRNVNEVKNGRICWLKMTGAQAASHLASEGGQLDFLFIDGDHSWEGIKGDWTGFRSLIQPGGIVALHDSRNSGGCGSERYTQDVILKDPDFVPLEIVGTLTVIRRA